MIEVYKIRILLTVIAILIAIDFAVLSYVFQKYASILLTIEVILLPSIYIIGNYYIEELLKKSYEKELESIDKKTEELGDKYLKLKSLNEILKARLKNETKKN